MGKPGFGIDRRGFIGAMGSALFLTKGAFAEELALTPRRTEGPFYPDKLPLDTDNDLILINDDVTPALGTITHLTGRILTASGSPIRDATIEIWQCDSKMVYLHTSDSIPKKAQRDAHFQGYGRFNTASDGGYRFRTIKPVPYPGRPAPHIHVRVLKGDRELITTQLNILGHPGNKVDHVVNEGLTMFERELLQVEFKPIKPSKIGEVAAHFEIIVGRTPDDSRIGDH